MKYRIFDMQTKDYLKPYDEDKEYWALEDAADLAYRRWGEIADREENRKGREHAHAQMFDLTANLEEAQVSRALEVFDYCLEKVEE